MSMSIFLIFNRKIFVFSKFHTRWDIESNKWFKNRLSNKHKHKPKVDFFLWQCTAFFMFTWFASNTFPSPYSMCNALTGCELTGRCQWVKCYPRDIPANIWICKLDFVLTVHIVDSSWWKIRFFETQRYQGWHL